MPYPIEKAAIQARVEIIDQWSRSDGQSARSGPLLTAERPITRLHAKKAIAPLPVTSLQVKFEVGTSLIWAARLTFLDGALPRSLILLEAKLIVWKSGKLGSDWVAQGTFETNLIFFSILRLAGSPGR